MKLPASFLALVLLLPAAALPAHGAPVARIYDDGVVNGWKPWGWAKEINYQNETVVRQGPYAISVKAEPWEAIYMTHDAMDVSAYDYLIFYIHGGPEGGQQLKVQCAVDGKAQEQGFTLPPLVPNVWQRVIIPLEKLGVSASPNLTGFWIQNRSAAAAPAFYLDDVALLPAVSDAQ